MGGHCTRFRFVTELTMTSAMTNQKPAVTLECVMSQLILTSIAGSRADSYGKSFSI